MALIKRAREQDNRRANDSDIPRPDEVLAEETGAIPTPVVVEVPPVSDAPTELEVVKAITPHVPQDMLGVKLEPIQQLDNKAPDGILVHAGELQIKGDGTNLNIAAVEKPEGDRLRQAVMTTVRGPTTELRVLIIPWREPERAENQEIVSGTTQAEPTAMTPDETVSKGENTGVAP